MARPIPITYGFELEARDGTIAVIRDRDAYDLRTLPHAEQVAALVALLRECPDAAVEAVDGCKVARPWNDDRREQLGERGGQPVVETVWGGGEWVDWSYLDSSGDTIADGETTTSDGAESAQAAADAVLVADGWVLAGVPRVG